MENGTLQVCTATQCAKVTVNLVGQLATCTNNNRIYTGTERPWPGNHMGHFFKSECEYEASSGYKFHWNLKCPPLASFSFYCKVLFSQHALHIWAHSHSGQCSWHPDFPLQMTEGLIPTKTMFKIKDMQTFGIFLYELIVLWPHFFVI